MKRTRQKLVLCIETLRTLGANRLKYAVGGTDSARCAMAFDSANGCYAIAEAFPTAPVAKPK